MGEEDNKMSAAMKRIAEGPRYHSPDVLKERERHQAELEAYQQCHEEGHMRRFEKLIREENWVTAIKLWKAEPRFRKPYGSAMNTSRETSHLETAASFEFFTRLHDERCSHGPLSHDERLPPNALEQLLGRTERPERQFCFGPLQLEAVGRDMFQYALRGIMNDFRTSNHIKLRLLECVKSSEDQARMVIDLTSELDRIEILAQLSPFSAVRKSIVEDQRRAYERGDRRLVFASTPDEGPYITCNRCKKRLRDGEAYIVDGACRLHEVDCSDMLSSEHVGSE